jgi:hypothetical protein
MTAREDFLGAVAAAKTPAPPRLNRLVVHEARHWRS